MRTHPYSPNRRGWLRPVLGALATASLAAGVQAQDLSTIVSSNLLDPNFVTADPNGNIYFTDSSDNRIAEFEPTTNAVLTFAGYPGPQYSGTNNGIGTAARFNQPIGITFDSYRNGLVVVDSGNQTLRYISLSGSVSNLAGVVAPIPFEGGGHVDGSQFIAKFSTDMTGISSDGAGNIYIADAGNNCIRILDKNNNVSTLTLANYTLNQPNHAVPDGLGNLWIADTKNDTLVVVSNISVIANQTAYVVAGTKGVTGTNDNLTAASALFRLPSALLWDPNGAGLFISDTGNSSIRRFWANASQGGAFSVQTVAGLPAQPGYVDGALNIAQLDNPVGLSVDTLNAGYYVVDRGNKALRRLQATAPQPPVPNPVIGYVTFVVPPSGGIPASVFNPATNEVFNNDAIIAVRQQTGVQTYMTFGPTPLNQYVNTIPTPGPASGTSPNIYAGDGNSPAATFPSVLAPEPDVTMYVISEATGRQASQIESARFQFVTANPNIGGFNAAAVALTDNTTNAVMYYTLDGTTPTNNGDTSIGPVTNGEIISFDPSTNTKLTVIAFRNGFAPSGTVEQIFSPSNFIPNSITFGFQSGEASSEFVGSAGSRFYAPVTLNLLPNPSIYSMQFNVTITNISNAPPIGLTYTFNSMLVYPTNEGGETFYITIPPASWNGQYMTNVVTNIVNGSTNTVTNTSPIISSLLFTNTSENLLGVGWLELINGTNLYPAVSQQLVTYSLAHETIFSEANGTVVVGAYSFRIPANATPGQAYQIQLGRPSADADGFALNFPLSLVTNGSIGQGPINSVKNVTIGVTPYLVGDVAPFRWFNAGDFGDLQLLNNDVLEVFRAGVYDLNRPLPGSDFADAYDSSDGSLNNLYTGDAAAINNIQFGDGLIDVSDVYVTYQRSLDPALTWYERYWSNGVFYAQAVPNQLPTTLTKAKLTPSAPIAKEATRQVLGVPRYVTVGASRVVASPGSQIQVPINVLAADTLPITVAAVNVDIIPLDGSPAVTNTITFTPNSGLGTPTLTDSQGVNNYAAAWLNASAPGVSGTTTFGSVNVSIPPSATSNSAYLVHIEHFSGSPNGLATFHSTIYDGLITVGSARTNSSWGDAIPDWWRLTWFGTVSNVLSSANLDADGDGANNYQEFMAGTNPEDPNSVLEVLGVAPQPNFSVQWPSVLGKTYSVQCSPSLFGGTWNTIASGIAGTGQTLTVADPNLPAPPSMFYRVVVQ